MGGEDHRQAHSVPVLGGACTDLLAGGRSALDGREHLPSVFSSCGAGGERKGAPALWTGHWFAGKGGGVFKGLLEGS